ncbi:BEN domain-containing protein 6 [Lingula anatina]|uniref:BEN domain-containing protein 6 n=1 Tax=Lingula anatina TaxID=7574 RepID=A0A1S3JET2_LINAN|nr:BEN domain-containing protein 6 [Lingula anatina]|eukprot:XP_013408848.1 BEN domain-containing protein 6 [Lingula anatina]
MKFALFEFTSDLSCVVGDCSWIHGQPKLDPETWDFSKEVIVKWPGKRKQQTDYYGARIVKFGDDKKTLVEFLDSYVATGDCNTPTRGREGGKSKRMTKKNSKYESDEDDEEEDDCTAIKKLPPAKKTKRSLDSTSMLAIRKKLEEKLEDAIKPQDGQMEVNPNDECELRRLKEENRMLKEENENLKSVIANMRALASVERLVGQLTSAVSQVQAIGNSSNRAVTPATPQSVKIASSCTRTPSPATPQTVISSSNSSRSSSAESDDENMVLLYPGLSIHREEKALLERNRDPKKFIYCLMDFLWSRDVLATHSLTGKSCNAHKDKGAKPQLNQAKVVAMCDYVCKRFAITDQEAKRAITAKLNNVQKLIRN